MSKQPGWMWNEGLNDRYDGEEHRRWATQKDPTLDRRKWFKDYTYTTYPLKAQLQEGDPELVLAGWRPAEPLISPDTRVLTMGSCFAAQYAEWLVENGYNQDFTSASRALLRNPFENTTVIAQQFRWAFGEVDPSSLLWVDKEKQQLLATEERRLALRQTFLDAEVFITTLSLSETWYDRVSGEPLWRVIPADLHNPERHAFKVLSFAENLQALETIDRIRRQWLPNLRIIFTVSPMPLWSTIRPISAVTANSASKAIVRGALDEFLRSRSEEFNRVYFYFPSYELVTTLFKDVFESDARHIYKHVIEAVFQAFASVYTTNGFGSSIKDTPQWKAALGENATLAHVEGELFERLASEQRLVEVYAKLQAEHAALDAQYAALNAKYAALDTRYTELTSLRQAQTSNVQQPTGSSTVPPFNKWLRRALADRIR